MFTVCALYHFTRFEDHKSFQKPLQDLCENEGITGSLLLAQEGINGTVAGPTRASIDRLIAFINNMPGCSDFEYKLSTAQEQPFLRAKVKLKKEIVTMGQPDVDPKARVGHYCTPEEWNELISSDDVAVIDTRNDYEVAIGTFKGAIDPKTATFRDFPQWWEENKARFHNKKVAMFCTGGIRCEKSTNYLLGQGVEDVYHLKGGILKYLEEVPKEESLWDGDCFVFDQRVSIGHGLEEGPHDLCHACRRPIVPEDKKKPQFEQGVSCHQCIDQYDEARKERFRERQKQISLAKARGELHIGR